MLERNMRKELWLWLLALAALLLPVHAAFEELSAGCPQTLPCPGAQFLHGHPDDAKSDHCHCFLKAVDDSFRAPHHQGSGPGLLPSSGRELAKFPLPAALRVARSCGKPAWIPCSSVLHSRVGLRLYA